MALRRASGLLPRNHNRTDERGKHNLANVTTLVSACQFLVDVLQVFFKFRKRFALRHVIRIVFQVSQPHVAILPVCEFRFFHIIFPFYSRAITLAPTRAARTLLRCRRENLPRKQLWQLDRREIICWIQIIFA